MNKTKVLMVCLGNICRSPLAEGILRSKVNAENVWVDSAGTAAYHIGSAPDSRSIEVGYAHGVDISNQKARVFSQGDFDDFDCIYAMDQSNYDNILSLSRNENDRSKVMLILNELFPNENREVPDPYYGGRQGFDNVYQLLDASCGLIAQRLIKKYSP